MEDRLKHYEAVFLNISYNLHNSLRTMSCFLLYNPTLHYRALLKVSVSFDQTQHFMTAAEPPRITFLGCMVRFAETKQFQVL